MAGGILRRSEGQLFPLGNQRLDTLEGAHGSRRHEASLRSENIRRNSISLCFCLFSELFSFTMIAPVRFTCKFRLDMRLTYLLPMATSNAIICESPARPSTYNTLVPIPAIFTATDFVARKPNVQAPQRWHERALGVLFTFCLHNAHSVAKKIASSGSDSEVSLQDLRPWYFCGAMLVQSPMNMRAVECVCG